MFISFKCAAINPLRGEQIGADLQPLPKRESRNAILIIEWPNNRIALRTEIGQKGAMEGKFGVAKILQASQALRDFCLFVHTLSSYDTPFHPGVFA
jgi:hypothetical protein